MQIGLSLSMCGGSGGMAGVNAQLATLLSSALIPGRDGVVTVTRAGVEPNPMGGADAAANTANARTLNVGGYSFPGAAFLAQGASTGLFGAATTSAALNSNTTASGDYPTQRTIVEDTAGPSQHRASTAAVALTDGITYTASTLVKMNNGRGLSLRFIAGANVLGVTITSAGAISSAVAGTCSVASVGGYQLPNGWWFIYINGSASAWGSSPRLDHVLVNASATNYTGDGVSGITFAGYRVTQSNYPTGPGAWDGDTVARNASLLSWNQSLSLTAGTMISIPLGYGWSDTFGPAAGRMYDGLSTGGMQHNTAAQTFSAYRTDALVAANLATSAAVAMNAGQQRVVIQRWDASSNRIRINGVNVASAAPTLPFAASTPIILGNVAALTGAIDGWVANILFTTALSDSDADLIASYSSII